MKRIIGLKIYQIYQHYILPISPAENPRPPDGALLIYLPTVFLLAPPSLECKLLLDFGGRLAAEALPNLVLPPPPNPKSLLARVAPVWAVSALLSKPKRTLGGILAAVLRSLDHPLSWTRRL